MAQSNPQLLGLGDHRIEPGNKTGTNVFPPKHVAVLISPWGIEGVFSSPEMLDFKIRSLREYRAYENEPFAYKLENLDDAT